ncbi:MAG: rhamnulokinase family protein [Sedimentisphaeraceae bacterium JB056]
MESRNYIAVDMGAESGRVMLGVIAGCKLELHEIHRFATGATPCDDGLHWDFPRLFGEIKDGIKKAIAKADGKVESIAVDSWGVDFGMLDENGELLFDPYHYRDSRTNGMVEKVAELTGGKDVIYNNTGIQFMQINTLYQLYATKLANPELFDKCSKIVMIADLVAYKLCGRAFCEYTLASTSQALDMKSGQWSKPLFDAIGVDVEKMAEVVAPGSVVGQMTKEMADELGCDQINIVAAGSHDTASAVAAVPAIEGDGWAYLSCGTWSLLGVETPKAIINDDTYSEDITNEGGVYNTIRLLKNIMGLWLLQECRRCWANEGQELDYAQLTQMAIEAKPLDYKIDPDYPGFLAPENMPKEINKHLRERGLSEITDKGQMVRTILESLAVKYEEVLKKFEFITDTPVSTLHLVGGGIKNELLCKLTATATGKKVVAGPVEATASGNILIQAIASGQVVDLAAAREIVANSFEPKTYMP